MRIEEIKLLHIENHPDRKEFTYLESAYYEEVNAYIDSHYDELQRRFIDCKYTFNYLPFIYKQLSKSRSIQFYCPGATEEDVERLRKFSTSDFAQLLMPEGEEATPMIVRYLRRDGKYDWYQAAYFEQDVDINHQIDDLFEYLDPIQRVIEKRLGSALKRSCAGPAGKIQKKPNLSKAEEGDVLCDMCFNASLPSERYRTDFRDSIENALSYADDTWDDDMKKAASVAAAAVEHLRQHGVSETVIAAMFAPQIKPSKVVVNNDYSIYLPDFRIDFDFKPRERAVYILFLSHPEGIRLKDLPDYQKQLESIYSTITNRVNEESVQRTLENVCDPTRNTMNEICAHIRTAIMQKMQEPLARYYYIDGQRGEPKYIRIAREGQNKVIFD